MTKEEQYKKAEALLKLVAETLNLMIDNNGEDITCYFAAALDEQIHALIDAKLHMVVAENIEQGKWLCETCKFHNQDWTCNNKEVLRRIKIVLFYINDDTEFQDDFGCRFWEVKNV